jgi:hypothetical protein
MSNKKFLLALKRLTRRRALPNTVYTDNAKNFHATNCELRELCAVFWLQRHNRFRGTRNTLDVYRTPGVLGGGWWIIIIVTTKRCIRKALGQSQLEAEGIQTILVGTEASLHSRPITQDDDVTLTPSHFLTGGTLTAISQGPEPVLTQFD